MRRFAFIPAVLTIALILDLASCGDPAVVSRRVARGFDYNAAAFNTGYELPASEFYDIVYYSQLEPEGGVIDVTRIKSLLDSMLIDTLAGVEANEFNLRDNWSQHRVYKNQIDEFLTRLFWERMLPDEESIDSQQVADFYADYGDLYYAPEQVDLYHILCSPRTIRVAYDTTDDDEYMPSDDAWRLAEDQVYKLYRMLNYGVPFTDVARAYSHDVTSDQQGGYLGWTVRAKYPDPFDSVAFSLEPGEYSAPYRDVDGWHIIYIAGYQEEGAVPLDGPGVYSAAHGALLKMKSRERGRAIIDSLRQGISLEINDVVLDTPIYYVDDSTWAGVVNGADTIDARRLKGMEEGYRRRYGVDNTTMEIRLEMIQQAAIRYAVVQAAQDMGLDQLANFIEVKKQLWHGKCKTLILADRYGEDWLPPDSMMRNYYDAHIDEYVPPKPLTLRHLIVADSALAEFLREQAMTGIYLSDLADEYGRRQGYDVTYQDLGNVGLEDIDDRIYKAAMRPSGLIGGLARTERGFHVIKIVQRLRATPYSMAMSSIRNMMVQQYHQAQWEKFRDNLYAKHQVKIFDNFLPLRVPRLADRYKHKP
jgi:hypothetical protein